MALRDAFIIREARVEHWGETIAIHDIGSAYDVDQYWPGFSKLWPQIKAECESKQRKPRSIYMTEKSEPFHQIMDYALARRILVDLRSNKVLGGIHTGGGENAINYVRQNQAISGQPEGTAILNVEWHDGQRLFSIKAQFPPGTLVKFLPGGKPGAV
jgi:hypothetical protein